MKGVSIQYDANFEPLLQHLDNLADIDLDKLLRDIGSYMVTQIQDRFDGQILWDGSPMPQSQAAKDRKGKTLIEFHHLYDSYVYQLIDGGVEIGSNSVYARIHHYGGQTGRGGKTRIEARPVLGVNDHDEQVIGDKIVRAIGAT